MKWIYVLIKFEYSRILHYLWFTFRFWWRFYGFFLRRSFPSSSFKLFSFGKLIFSLILLKSQFQFYSTKSSIFLDCLNHSYDDCFKILLNFNSTQWSSLLSHKLPPPSPYSLLSCISLLSKDNYEDLYFQRYQTK